MLTTYFIAWMLRSALQGQQEGPWLACDPLVHAGLKDGAESVLTEGYDFYSSPRLSADGSKLAWVAWRHPNMPWSALPLALDGTRCLCTV